MDEFNKDLNPDNNIDNLNKEENNSFDFDLSILDKVKPPQVELEKKEEETNPIDEIHPMDLDQHIAFEMPALEEVKSEEDINPMEQEENTQEEVEDTTPGEYNDNPFINNNPYEEAVENTNPYVDYDDMEAVIGNTDTEEKEQYEEPESTPVEEVKEETPIVNNNEKIDTDFKELEKEQKKQERAEKVDNMKFVFLFLMFIVVAALIAYFHFSDDREGPKEIPQVDVKTGDNDKDKDKDKDPEPPTVEGDFNKKVEDELNNYFSDGDTTGLSTILSSSYSDTTKVEDIHNTTNTVVESWINTLLTKDYDNYEAFTSAVNNTRSKLDGLYNIKYTDVGYLEEDKYEEYSTKLNNIDEDSNDYYVALELYNKKDYNKAYQALEAISSSNSFYDSSQKHMNDIVTSILDLLKSDIKKISTNLDFVNDSEKQGIYKQIKSIIEKYAIAYPYVKLNNNEEYNELYKKYNDLIKE